MWSLLSSLVRIFLHCVETVVQTSIFNDVADILQACELERKVVDTSLHKDIPCMDPSETPRRISVSSPTMMIVAIRRRDGGAEYVTQSQDSDYTNEIFVPRRRSV
ncbi:hypothetical protein EDC01DRAFT_188885 [Geopyxis carbonaria]|nr:hypothetical protein EDC01DRAFT_188885 [Geopyxis carbonaria]